MKPVVVKQALRWLQRSDRDFAHITLYRFFGVAYFWHFRTANPGRIAQDMVLMEREGQVPFYLQLFLRKKLYPTLVKENATPEVKLIV